jgi:toxin FitB
VSFLLDTNVLSEVRKGARANPGVQTWFAQVRDEDLYLSVMVLGEVRQGIESIRRRDIAGAQQLEVWFKGLGRLFSGRVLSVDERVADAWGKLNVPNPLPTTDGLLAATAQVHGLTVVTRNLRDLRRTGVATLDPFSR